MLTPACHSHITYPAFTTLKTLLHSLYLFFLLPAVQGAPFADLLLLNGPGTAVPIILAVTCSRVRALIRTHTLSPPLSLTSVDTRLARQVLRPPLPTYDLRRELRSNPQPQRNRQARPASRRSVPRSVGGGIRGGEENGSGRVRRGCGLIRRRRRRRKRRKMMASFDESCSAGAREATGHEYEV
jgi:hypothetical protein